MADVDGPRRYLRDALLGLLRRDFLVAGALGLFVVLVVFYLMPIVDEELLSFLSRRINPLLFLPLVLVALQWRLGWITATEDRRFWHDLTLAFAFWWAGALIMLFFPESPRPRAVDLTVTVLYALYFVALLMAIERQPHRRHRWRPIALERRLTWPVVLLVVSGLMLYFPLTALYFDPRSYASGVPDLTLYVALDIYVMLRMIYLLRATRSPRWRSIYLFLAAAFGLIFLSDLVTALHLLTDHEFWNWQGLPNAVLNLPFVLVVIAARLRHRRFPSERSSSGRPELEENLPGPLGQTLSFILVFPVIHFVTLWLDLSEPSMVALREDLLLGWLVLLSILAAAQYRVLDRTLEGLRRERLRAERTLHRLEQDMMLQAERQATHRTLRVSNRLFREAFGASPDVMAISRLADGTFTDMNASSRRVFGWEPEEVVGRTSTEIGLWARAEDRDRIVEILQEKGRVNDFEAPFGRKDGSSGIGLFSASILELEGEKFLFSVTHDVTAKRRRDAARHCRISGLEGARAAILAIDGQGRIAFLNAAAETLSGRRADEVLGRPAAEVLGGLPAAGPEFATELERLTFFGPDGRELGVAGWAVGVTPETPDTLGDADETAVLIFVHPLESSAAPAGERAGAP